MAINLISSVSKEHGILSEVSLKHIIYFYILANVEKTKFELFSAYTDIDISDKFSFHYDEADIDKALAELVSEELIVICTDGIQVGTIVDNKRKLFTGKSQNINAEKLKLLDYANMYIEDCKGTARSSVVKEFKAEIIRLFFKPVQSWVATDLSNLFRLTHTVYFQDSSRTMTAKEDAQIKQLLKFYDTITIIKMIVYYICNNEEFGSLQPNVSLFHYNKDTVYAKVRGISRKDIETKNIRTITEEEGF